MSDYCSIYVTAADKEEADSIARALLKENLIACANVFGGVTSHFRWEDEVHCDDEAVVLLKTRAALAGAVTDRVKALHSYDCPCVLVWPIQGGNAEFLSWIADETSVKG